MTIREFEEENIQVFAIQEYDGYLPKKLERSLMAQTAADPHSANIFHHTQQQCAQRYAREDGFANTVNDTLLGYPESMRLQARYHLEGQKPLSRLLRFLRKLFLPGDRKVAQMIFEQYLEKNNQKRTDDG